MGRTTTIRNERDLDLEQLSWEPFEIYGDCLILVEDGSAAMYNALQYEAYFESVVDVAFAAAANEVRNHCRRVLDRILKIRQWLDDLIRRVDEAARGTAVLRAHRVRSPAKCDPVYCILLYASELRVRTKSIVRKYLDHRGASREANLLHTRNRGEHGLESSSDKSDI